MSFKLNSSVLLKKDANGCGILFSTEDKAESYLKLDGLALYIATKLLEGISLSEIRKSILKEYAVSEEKLESDIAAFKDILKKHGFLAE